MNVKELRSKYGLSQGQLSEQTGIPKGRINGWEQQGTQPKAEDSAKLEAFFADLEKKGTQALKVNRDADPEKIPFYDVMAVGGLSVLAEQTPVSEPTEMIDPGTWFRSATGALRVYGHSMFPKYPSGCIVAFKKSNENIPAVIVWGEDYVIELADRRILKRVDRGETKGSIKAVSYNVNKDNKYVYDPIEIPLTAIKRMYMVLGKVELEASI